MGLDVRLPIGAMFTIIGVLLAGFGFLAGSADGERAAMDINLWWGLVLTLFGLLMLWLGRRGTATMQLASRSPEGRSIERAEHSRKLEG